MHDTNAIVGVIRILQSERRETDDTKHDQELNAGSAIKPKKVIRRVYNLVMKAIKKSVHRWARPKRMTSRVTREMTTNSETKRPTTFR